MRVLVEATKEARLDVKIGGYTHTLEISIEPHHAHTIIPKPGCPEAADGNLELQNLWLKTCSKTCS